MQKSGDARNSPYDSGAVLRGLFESRGQGGLGRPCSFRMTFGQRIAYKVLRTNQNRDRGSAKALVRPRVLTVFRILEWLNDLRGDSRCGHG